MSNLEFSVFSILNDSESNRIGKVFNVIILILILLSVTLLILDTFDALPEWTYLLSATIEVVITVVFTIEYLMRIWVSDGLRPEMRQAIARIRYAISFMALVDLVSILPFYLSMIIPMNIRAIRMLRMVRIVRLLKVNRYTEALTITGDVIKSKSSQLISSLAVVLVLLVVASLFMYAAEHDTQPEVFQNAFSGLWWAMATVTTVGYGDIYPMTWLGQILGALIALLGVALVAIPTGILSAGFSESDRDKDRKTT